VYGICRALEYKTVTAQNQEKLVSALVSKYFSSPHPQAPNHQQLMRTIHQFFYKYEDVCCLSNTVVFMVIEHYEKMKSADTNRTKCLNKSEWLQMKTKFLVELIPPRAYPAIVDSIISNLNSLLSIELDPLSVKKILNIQ